ncbi:MAG: hypothetical protein AAB505_01710, partial [Patescibacteria group bacterium]
INNKTLTPVEVNTFTNRIVDLSNIPPEKRSNRYRLLKSMTETKRDFYEKNQTYLLDDNNPPTRVTIGVYKADDYGEKGGIIMLKHLTNNQYYIYWEINSPFLWKPEQLIKEVRDINNDGLKELVIYSEGGALYRNIEEEYNDKEFWIISLDPKIKTYKVLNPIVGKKKDSTRDFNFEHTDSDVTSWNRFYFLMKRYDKFPDLFQDKDGDGILEVIIIDPALENLGLIPTSPDMVGKGRYTQIYKWSGVEYYLWKEVAETSPEFKELFK